MNKTLYFASKGQFLICDPNFIGRTKDAFELNFNDFALDAKLLEHFYLLDVHINSQAIGLNYKKSDEEALEMFAGYFSSFISDQEKAINNMNYFLTNPSLKFFIINPDLNVKLQPYFEEYYDKKLVNNIDTF
jgi:hypothetical protein